MKKILYTATVTSHICQFHLPYFKMLKEMGYEVHVAAHDNLAEKNGLEMKHVDKFFEIPFRRSPFSAKNLKAKKQLKRIIDSEDYEIIVCNTPVGGIMTRLAAKGARRRGTRVIYIAHGFHFYKGASKKNWLIYYPIEKHFAKKCDTVVTITGEDYALASRKFKCNVRRIHGVGVDGARHFAVTDEEKLRVRAELGVDEGEFVCLCTGELNENKNQIRLIRLVPEIRKRIPSFKLWLAGNGPTANILEEEMVKLGASDSVTLLGYCPDIEKYIRACDIVASVSRREGLPFNIVEAQLTRRPVVTSVNRGHRELVENGITGFMTNDDNEIIENICRLHTDRELYERVAERACDWAQSYTVEAVKRELFEILLGS